MVSILIVIAYKRTPRELEYKQTRIEVLPQTRFVEIEVVDEMLKEKVRNLYEEQDVYNAKISYLIRQNKQYEYDIEILDQRLQGNIEDMRTQARIQPGIDIRVLKSSYEDSNRNINNRKLKIEGMILTNSEKIIQYKKKSNSISEQIIKIGKEVYNKQRGM
jgi:hypothetical protein